MANRQDTRDEAQEFQGASQTLVDNLYDLADVIQGSNTDRQIELIDWLDGDITMCRTSLTRVEQIVNAARLAYYEAVPEESE